MNVFERLKIIDELARKTEEGLLELWPAPGRVKNHFEIRFYSDDEKEEIGIKLFLNDDFEIIPTYGYIDAVKKATSADDIFIDVKDGYIEAIELLFEEADAE